MKFIAPNLSALVGTQLASKLMAGAGGIEKLANMPACNIQVMGSIRRNMLGFSRAMSERNRGYFGSIDLVQKAPAKF
jgi:U4/U6 small nuclear ribonucleoprotein PRP31